MKFNYVANATPLDPDEMEGLIPIHVTMQEQLNEWEADNILQAEVWLTSRIKKKELLTVEFVKLLHKKMFDKTWQWAGKFRNTEKNIGINPELIASAVVNLIEDVKAQIKYGSFPDDEIAYRFHHRLVAIHPFANGNGRHARLITDLLLIEKLGEQKFTWGRKNLSERSVRKDYIDALKAADKHDYSLLSQFVRS